MATKACWPLARFLFTGVPSSSSSSREKASLSGGREGREEPGESSASPSSSLSSFSLSTSTPISVMKCSGFPYLPQNINREEELSVSETVPSSVASVLPSLLLMSKTPSSASKRRPRMPRRPMSPAPGLLFAPAPKDKVGTLFLTSPSIPPASSRSSAPRLTQGS